MLTIQPYETAQQSLCAFDIDPDSPPPSIAADIEIAIVDDRPLMCDCLARGLAVFEPAFRFQHFSSIEAFDAASLDETQRISTVLMCVMWSNSEADHHLARIAHLKATRPSVNAIILADIENLDDILKAIEKGARGYVPTSVSLQVAAKAIHLVAAGGIFIPPSVLYQSAQNAKDGQQTGKQQSQDDNVFTSRQISVIEALRRGKANKIIAYELNMCESTVKVHVRNIMKKLRARNRTEVAYILNTTPYQGLTRN
ncbi:MULTISPECIES: response regulator transcription factor [Mesorhizobium]|jgi:DNA-binding NarL/FixJ family response regulator|uniref:DNA-binding NarL/FixJ family response regulator n=1 Tax=Rhizobium loti TaxID=381 RepID=A0A8E3B4E9_RHILI|nr:MULTISPECIES: response regulator transcription factor [Mesorhizobium]PWJ90405.1 DNA-binding NarL/FixJ family response regulator [Mesorhizobium loti]RUX93310.1 response regulator transcription factor [Mesorhizobium sp. M7D.F.Ca.US.004.01.2.1]RVA32569.1 response regulator transcription factor [Mesorhizobium sp. M7D.F.Ca.US.004.03.1.1]